MRIQPKMDILVKIGTIVVAVVAMIVDVLTVGIVTLVMFAKLIIKGIEMDYKYFELRTLPHDGTYGSLWYGIDATDYYPCLFEYINNLYSSQNLITDNSGTYLLLTESNIEHIILLLEPVTKDYHTQVIQIVSSTCPSNIRRFFTGREHKYRTLLAFTEAHGMMLDDMNYWLSSSYSSCDLIIKLAV